MKANGKIAPPPPPLQAPPAPAAAPAPPPPAAAPPAPALQAPPMGQAPPTIDQLIAEGHARGRRINGDQVYLGALLDTLYSELAAREKRIQDLTAELAAKGKP